MGALDGTIKTPIGTVEKKTALILGGGVVVLGIIVWYRQKQMDTSSGTIPEAEINPATGYPYGSAEDAAALAAQNAYVSPPANGGGGGTSTYPTTNGYTSNSQWVQGVIEYMVGHDLIDEPAQLSAALGKYIIGAYVTDTENSLIQQAIAVQDFPPVSGPNGYPPSVNKTPPNGAPTTTTGEPAAPHLHHVTTQRTSAILQWNPAANAAKYIVYQSGGKTVASNVTGTSYTVTGLKADTSYSFSVASVNSAGKRSGKTSNVVTVRTKK
jgi:hypothetical protein